jgi:hypothetical protein
MRRPPRGKKRVIQKKHGSFNLLGLMDQSTAAQADLDAEEAKANEKREAEIVLLQKREDDKVAFLMCQRSCNCKTEECEWAHHKLCDDCFRLRPPFTECTTKTCVAKRREEKKQAAEAAKVQAKQDLIDFKNGTRLQDHAICSNPPCQVLLAPGKRCMKRPCSKWRKENEAPVRRSARDMHEASVNQMGTAAARPRRRTPRAAKSPERRSPSPDQAGEWEGTPSPQPNRRRGARRQPSPGSESEFEVDAVVAGPQSSDGKYQVKWRGYSPSQNTWEPEDAIPIEFIGRYKRTKKSAQSPPTSSDSDDDRPIHETLGQGLQAFS